jgi:hypothetical protein
LSNNSGRGYFNFRNPNSEFRVFTQLSSLQCPASSYFRFEEESNLKPEEIIEEIGTIKLTIVQCTSHNYAVYE